MISRTVMDVEGWCGRWGEGPPQTTGPEPADPPGVPASACRSAYARRVGVALTGVPYGMGPWVVEQDLTPGEVSLPRAGTSGQRGFPFVPPCLRDIRVRDRAYQESCV